MSCWNASPRWNRNWKARRCKASAVDDQVALMVRSYDLAAKYMGGQNGGKSEQVAEPYLVQKGKKNKAIPLRQVTCQIVSSLAQPMSNAVVVGTGKIQ